MRRASARLLAGFVASIAASHAGAQPSLLKLHEINFDMWCQQHRHLPPARCDRRLPQDDAAFQSYANTIERYEMRRLHSQARERNLGRMIESDPVDNPNQPAVPPPNLPPQ